MLQFCSVNKKVKRIKINFQMSGKMETAVKEKQLRTKFRSFIDLICKCDLRVICMFVVAL